MTEQITKQNIEMENLIKLLDDEDEYVYENVKSKFIEFGNEAKNFLIEYTFSDNKVISERAEEIINYLNFKNIEDKFLNILDKKDILEDAVFLIAEYEYPEMNSENYKMILDKMAIDIEGMIFKRYQNYPSVNDKLNALNYYLFVEKGYTGNEKDFYSPDNSYINKVMDKKTGIPISLSILYMLLAKRIGIQIHGINLPSHYIVKFKNEQEEIFIDPFNKGALISKEDAVLFLKRIGIDEENLDNVPFLKPADDFTTIKRLLGNLINIYNKLEDKRRTDELSKLILLFGGFEQEEEEL